MPRKSPWMLLLFFPGFGLAQERITIRQEAIPAEHIEVTAEVVPSESIVYRMPIQGRCRYLKRFGERVQKGDALYQLFPEAVAIELASNQLELADVEAQIEALQDVAASPEMQQKQRSLKRAQQQLAQAQRHHTASRSLYEIGAIARDTLEQDFIQMQSHQDAIQGLQSEIKQLKRRASKERLSAMLSKHRHLQQRHKTLQQYQATPVVYAEKTGVFLKPSGNDVENSSTSQYFGEGAVIALLASLTPTTLGSDVSEWDLPKIGLSQQVEVRFNHAPFFTVQGKVRYISTQPKLDGHLPRYPIEVQLEVEQNSISLGMRAQLMIQGKAKSGILIPKTSITANPQGYWVKVQGQGDTLVRIGQVLGDKIEVTAGLREGDVIEFS